MLLGLNIRLCKRESDCERNKKGLGDLNKRDQLLPSIQKEIYFFKDLKLTLKQNKYVTTPNEPPQPPPQKKNQKINKTKQKTKQNKNKSKAQNTELIVFIMYLYSNVFLARC